MKFKDYLLGPTEPTLFGACIFFAAIGIFLFLLLGTTARDKTSDLTSPKEFSFSYLWSDNMKRIYASGLCVLMALRFTPELFGWELNVWKAFCIGFGFDGLMFFIKQKTNLLDPKAKP